MDVDLASRNKHINTHVHTNFLAQSFSNGNHILNDAVRRLRNVFTTEIEIVLDGTRIRSSAREVDSIATSITVGVLHASGYEATELVQSIPSGINDSDAFAACGATINDINGNDFAGEGVQLVLGIEVAVTNKLFHDDLGFTQCTQISDDRRECQMLSAENFIRIGVGWVLLEHIHTLTCVEVCRLDDISLGSRWNAAVNAVLQIGGIRKTTVDVRRQCRLRGGKDVGAHLVIQIRKPVILEIKVGINVGTLAGLDQECKGFIDWTIIRRLEGATQGALILGNFVAEV